MENMDISISNTPSRVDDAEEFPVTVPVETIMDVMMQGIIDRWRVEILLSQGGINEESKIEW
ncbi:hypothetical protein NG42_05100 [Winslowiella iniecta]|uniref:Uncharacterized protein n=2 Tax=Winslowiella iniecta TaxID=1560201 RepID=A0A0L7T8T7_9GAMM|nr:hypothetical protein NG42_05100 [Winslowiella iniecta]KOC94433.1 hypothetical protein NG43_04405 [Winslowiella iniecta]